MFKKFKYIVSIISILGIFVPLSNNVVHADVVKTNKSGTINLSDDYSVEYVTPTKMVETFAKDNNITFEEALSKFPKNFLYQTRSGNVTHPIYTRTLNASNWFRPQIRLYVREVDDLFDKVLLTSLVSYGKVFQGEVFINVENQKSIYFNVNGIFYNTGNVSVSGGVNIGIGDMVSVKFSVSGADNQHAWIAFDGHFRK